MKKNLLCQSALLHKPKELLLLLLLLVCSCLILCQCLEKVSVLGI